MTGATGIEPREERDLADAPRGQSDAEVALLVRQWAESATRSSERRAERRRVRRRATLARAGRIAGVLVVPFLVVGIVALTGDDEPTLKARGAPSLAAVGAPALTPISNSAADQPPPVVPSRRQLTAAREYAADRLGAVSFAVVDSEGDAREMEGDRTYVTASVVKAMLLVAELDRLVAGGAPLDTATRDSLERMITYSDNAAADLVYGRVGDAGLEAVAREAGLERFSVAGYWANAQLTAADMAKLMSRIEPLMDGPYAEFGLGVLERVVPEQRWGIPKALAGERWGIRFKGGWRGTDAGQLVHQIAHLRRDGTEVSLAVLTDGSPTMDYGIETVQGVAARLLRRPEGGASARSGSTPARPRASG